MRLVLDTAAEMGASSALLKLTGSYGMTAGGGGEEEEEEEERTKEFCLCRKDVGTYGVLYCTVPPRASGQNFS